MRYQLIYHLIPRMCVGATGQSDMASVSCFPPGTGITAWRQLCQAPALQDIVAVWVSMFVWTRLDNDETVVSRANHGQGFWEWFDSAATLKRLRDEAPDLGIAEPLPSNARRLSHAEWTRSREL